jgi:hypothetical protein
MMQHDATELISGETMGRPQGDPTETYHWRLRIELVEELDRIYHENPPKGVRSRVGFIDHILQSYVDAHKAKPKRSR